MKLDDLPGDSCLVCGACIEHKRIDAIYCSRKCIQLDRTKLEQEARWAQHVGRKCAQCAGQIPVAKQSNAKFCSRKCGHRAANIRYLARLKAERLARKINKKNGRS